MCVSVCMLSGFRHVRLFAVPWTIAHQVPLSMVFSRQEWIPISFSGGSFRPRDRTHISYVSCIGSWVFSTSDINSICNHNSPCLVRISIHKFQGLWCEYLLGRGGGDMILPISQKNCTFSPRFFQTLYLMRFNSADIYCS